MNIKFIGTGTMGSITRANTSILVDNILIDCGMGTVKQLERYGKHTKDIKHLVITHFHADHFFDLPNFLIGKNIRNECAEKLYIILPISGRRKVIDMMKFSFGDGNENYSEDIEEKYNVEFIELKDGEIYSFEDYTLAAVELKHGDCIPVYGYLLKKNDVVIGYTGDTGICDNFFKMCEQANYMFVDTTTLVSVMADIHISFEELKEFAEKYDNCKFYAVHRGDYEMPSKGKTFVPNDGDEINV